MANKGFDTRSFMEGAMKGLISQIDKKAKEKEKEFDLQRDIQQKNLDLQRDMTKYKLQKKADMDSRKSWLEEIRGQAEEGGLIKPQPKTTPAKAMDNVMGDGSTPMPRPQRNLGEASGEDVYGIDYGAMSRMTRPSLSEKGASLKPVSARDKMLALYGKLHELKKAGKTLAPNAEKTYVDLQKKLFGVGAESGEDLGFLGGNENSEKSPYPEYPDAFQENGVWKVMQNGKKYRIEA